MRMDSVLEACGFFHRQNEVAYVHKVGDVALSTVSVQGGAVGAAAGAGAAMGGKLVAVGDMNGTVSLLEVCDSNEKAAINEMFERQMKPM